AGVLLVDGLEAQVRPGLPPQVEQAVPQQRPEGLRALASARPATKRAHGASSSSWTRRAVARLDVAVDREAAAHPSSARATCWTPVAILSACSGSIRCEIPIEIARPR